MSRQTLLYRTDQWLSKRSWGTILALGCGLIGFIGLCDYTAGSRVILGPVYVLPVGLVTWYAGRDTGLSMALVSAASTFISLHPQAPKTGEDSTVALINSGLLLMLYLLVVAFTTRARGRLELEEQLARLDALTGSLNRRAFEEELEYHLALAAREGLPLTLAYIDVDDFKQINDRFGHTGGDRVLQAIASTLIAFCRRTDRVTRMGGDEFAVLLPNTHSQGAERIIREARRRFATAFEANSSHVTCSIGVVTFVNRHPDSRTVIEMADKLMYEVKKAGKGSILFRTEKFGATDEATQ